MRNTSQCHAYGVAILIRLRSIYTCDIFSAPRESQRIGAKLLGLLLAIFMAAPAWSFEGAQKPGDKSILETDVPAEMAQPVDTATAPPPVAPPPVVHPPVQRPPLPPPPDIAPLPTSTTKPIPSAAWRMTAMNLLAGKKLEKASSSRVFDAIYGDSLLAALGACWRSGLKVEALNSNAGEILTTLSNTNAKIVITLAETSEGKTRIAAGCHSGNSETARQAIESFLQLCAETLTKQERI